MAPASDWPWGTELVRTRVRGFEAFVYERRCHSLLDVLEMSERWAGRDFLVDDSRRLTYAEHRRAVGRVAARLSDAGVRRGDRVMLLAANSLEWAVSFWAVIHAGAIVVLGNSWWSKDETERAIAAADAELVLVDERREAVVGAAAKTLRLDQLGSLLSGDGATAEPSPPATEDDPAIILFTSGTSGAAKGAVLSHRSVIANQHNFLAATRRLPSQIEDDHPAVITLMSAPLFHTGGVQAVVTAVLTGTTLVFLSGRFDAARVLELIERERVTSWSGVPTMIQRVVEHPDIKTRDVSSLRSIGLGGAPLPPVVLERAAAAFPNARRGVSTNYGMTEAGGIVASAGGRDAAARPGTSGRPLPGVEVRIDAPRGEAGEILVRSAALMTGYWGDAESPIDSDGWLATGDIGRLDDDGFLYVVDRLKDVIIRGGENIASANVEAALLEHEDVAAVAVVGLPHPDLGEQVGAVIVPRSGSNIDVDDLRRFAGDRLAHFEVPSRWWIRHDELPVTATGKTDRRSLRAEWRARPERDGEHATN